MKIKWVPCSQNDEIPPNAVYAGTTNVDGQMYVARVNNIPGKVTLKDGTNKVLNFWVQHLGRSLYGEILTTNGTCKWHDIKRGQLIPGNAVFSGSDQCDDKVWVARDKTGEPGKLNCHNNKSVNPEMHNLWCHYSGKNAYGQILIGDIDEQAMGSKSKDLDSLFFLKAQNLNSWSCSKSGRK